MLIFLDHVLDLMLGLGTQRCHLLKNLIVDGHGMVTDNYTNYLWLNLMYFLKVPELPDFWYGNAFLWVSY